MDRYAAALDIIAQTLEYPAHARLLAEKTQDAAIRFIRRQAKRSEIDLLLHIACDLGFLTQALYLALAGALSGAESGPTAD